MIGEGGNPDVLDGARYDCLLSSHTLEHLANPIGALLAWKRLLRPDACLLLVVPHRDRSFDRRRPITDFTHLLEDFHSGVGEDDMTHVEEALKLHDYQWGDGTDRRAFREALRENFDRRTLHHHVFDTELVGRIVDFAGFQLRALEPCPLFHVIAVGELTSAGADNTEFLGSSAAWRRESPFPSDRRVATV
jgi:SAM-dependent methyltransferase